MAEKKYAKHVLPLPTRKPGERKGGPGPYDHEGIYAHKDHLGGAGCTLVFYYIDKPFEEGPPHRHDSHQLMLFCGSDPKNISDFDAEIEIGLGDEGEIQTITKPSVVSIPPGLTHCPLRFKRLTKPVLFFEIVLANQYQRVTTEGEKTADVYVKLL
jgi:hypothetical protein